MIKTITVTGQFDIYFDPNDHSSLLDAMEEQGVNITHMCKDGFCNQCICKKEAGEVEYFQEIILDDQENYILPCSCIPKTDMVIETDN